MTSQKLARQNTALQTLQISPPKLLSSSISNETKSNTSSFNIPVESAAPERGVAIRNGVSYYVDRTALTVTKALSQIPLEIETTPYTPVRSSSSLRSPSRPRSPTHKLQPAPKRTTTDKEARPSITSTADFAHPPSSSSSTSSSAFSNVPFTQPPEVLMLLRRLHSLRTRITALNRSGVPTSSPIYTEVQQQIVAVLEEAKLRSVSLDVLEWDNNEPASQNWFNNTNEVNSIKVDPTKSPIYSSHTPQNLQQSVPQKTPHSPSSQTSPIRSVSVSRNQSQMFLNSPSPSPSLSSSNMRPPSRPSSSIQQRSQTFLSKDGNATILVSPSPKRCNPVSSTTSHSTPSSVWKNVSVVSSEHVGQYPSTAFVSPLLANQEAKNSTSSLHISRSGSSSRSVTPSLSTSKKHRYSEDFYSSIYSSLSTLGTLSTPQKNKSSQGSTRQPTSSHSKSGSEYPS